MGSGKGGREREAAAGAVEDTGRARRGRGQSWALEVFFNFVTNKKWFFAFFIKLIWLEVGFLNMTGAEVGN